MKATALERYPVCFPEPGSEADTTSERGDSRPALRPSEAPLGLGHLASGACVSAETQKGFGSGLVCRPADLP